VTPIWSLLNAMDDEAGPSGRAESREFRIGLWRQLKRLLRMNLLWRHGRKCISRIEPPRLPTPSRQSCSILRTRRRKGRATVRPSLGADAVSTDNCKNPDGTNIPAGQSVIQLVRRDFREDGVTEPVAKTKSLPTRDEVSTAARQLATLPRNRKKWSGWLNERERIWRDRKIILANGQPAFAYGALRGQIVFFRDVPRQMEPGRWGVVPARQVRLYLNPAARLLGKLKKGRKERTSLLKAEAARRNGMRPCREGRRRGRRPINTTAGTKGCLARCSSEQPSGAWQG